jgi:hypothetical protein
MGRGESWPSAEGGPGQQSGMPRTPAGRDVVAELSSGLCEPGKQTIVPGEAVQEPGASCSGAGSAAGGIPAGGEG